MWNDIKEHIKNCQEEADKRRRKMENVRREQVKSSKKPEFVEEVEMDEDINAYTEIEPSPMKSCLDGYYSSAMLRKIADAMDRWGKELEEKNAS